MSEAQNHKSQFSADDIQQYVEGKLSARQMHEMEKAALDDPFLADAMEGLESSINRQGTGPIHADLAALQKRLEDRISGKRKKGILLLNPSWWQVAAALAILLGGGIVSYRVLNSKENKQGIAGTVISERKIARKDQEIPFASPSADSARANARAVADTEKKQRTIAKSEIKKQPPAGPADHARTALKKNIAAAAQRKSGDQDREKGKAEAESESLVRTERIARSKSPTALASEGQDDSEQNASRVSKSPAAGSFSGKVMDMENRPVEGATISIKNGSQAV